MHRADAVWAAVQWWTHIVPADQQHDPEQRWKPSPAGADPAGGSGCTGEGLHTLW